MNETKRLDVSLFCVVYSEATLKMVNSQTIVD